VSTADPKRADPERAGLLQGRSVFLSASIPVRPGFRRVSDAAVEIEEAVISLARTVLREAGIVLFGAHPSISPLVASVATEYLSPHLRSGEPPDVESMDTPQRTGPGVVIYQSHAYDGYLPDKTWEMYRMGYADLVWCKAQGGEKFDPRENRFQCPKSLRFMRQKMFERESPTVMVALGGMEGVLEEAALFQEMTQFQSNSAAVSPLYLMSTTGGATEQLASQSFAIGSGPQPHLVEEEWKLEIPERVAEIGRRSDPRARPFMPYPLIMQWLVQKIARNHPNQATPPAGYQPGS
jgi:hypothetical protein